MSCASCHFEGEPTGGPGSSRPAAPATPRACAGRPPGRCTGAPTATRSRTSSTRSAICRRGPVSSRTGRPAPRSAARMRALGRPRRAGRFRRIAAARAEPVAEGRRRAQRGGGARSGHLRASRRRLRRVPSRASVHGLDDARRGLAEARRRHRPGTGRAAGTCLRHALPPRPLGQRPVPSRRRRGHAARRADVAQPRRCARRDLALSPAEIDDLVAFLRSL